MSERAPNSGGKMMAYRNLWTYDQGVRVQTGLALALPADGIRYGER